MFITFLILNWLWKLLAIVLSEILLRTERERAKYSYFKIIESDNKRIQETNKKYSEFLTEHSMQFC